MKSLCLPENIGLEDLAPHLRAKITHRVDAALETDVRETADGSDAQHQCDICGAQTYLCTAPGTLRTATWIQTSSEIVRAQ